MSFTSLEFLLFLGLCLSLLHATRGLSVRTWLLVLFSYIFSLTFGIGGLALVTFLAVVSFAIGGKIGTAESDRARERWLWLGLCVNLLPLAFFKYSNFIASNVAILLHPLGFNVRVPANVVLPIVGVSYFTFTAMSYLLDVYNGKIEPSHSVGEYLCYIAYFPKLIAGPIVRAADFLPQFRRGFQVTAEDIEVGFGYFLVGAVKKLVIADHLAGHVSMIMASPQHYNAATLLQGVIGFTVQLYADFSGYSDMAIGCARLMGLKLPQNFLMPFSSINIAEFWRRWHITMSTWFRDYVFLPLEIGSRGMRSALVRAARNILITMLLCGLWHGASWNFVLYGGVHGVALAVYQLYSRVRQARSVAPSAFHLGTLGARTLTLSVVLLSNVLFATRTLPAAFTYFNRLLTWSSDGVSLGSPYILPLTALVVVAHLFINKDRNLIEEVSNYSMPIRIFAYSTLLFALTALVASEAVPFVYVRF
jgi:alginate O-acetyltransferase complex protein AlgI